MKLHLVQFCLRLVTSSVYGQDITLKNFLKNVDQALNLLGLSVQNFDQNIGYTKKLGGFFIFPINY